ncbi:MAG TPA: glycosyltransferase family 39 protein [Patescibacteria group bacterium]|nr:glycosyltransferase family 39 protein [Patescibacteria group bacterium]
MKIINKIFSSQGLLLIALVLAGILRLWHLGSIAPSLTPDEASLGYNAYSILKTGRDEFGKSLPIVFKSFGDYKPGLYVYLAVPSVAVFGLSEFSTRLPSAIFGILSIYLIYLIVRKLFANYKSLAIISAFVAATNPYLIYFSRGAWEANISITLTLAGIYFFLKSLDENKYIILSSIFFALTLIAYQGAKLSTAIVLLLLILINWKVFWKIKLNYLITSFVLGVIISIPIILTLFNGQAQRLTIFSVFSYPRLPEEIQTYSDGYFYLFHSDQLNYFRMVMSRWFNFYSGHFLFFDGDTANPVHTSPYQGILLLGDLLLLPIGLFTIFKNKLNKGTLFVILLLILSPFSAAISRDQTNAVRSLLTAIPLVIVISFGIYEVINYHKIVILAFIAVWIFGFIYFLDSYFVHLPAHNSNYWRYGYKQMVDYVTPLESKYKDIVFEQSFNQPYIYFLFYQKYDPAKYQKQANLVSSKYKGDVGFETKLDNVRFERVDWSALQFTNGTLVVTGPTIPPEVISRPEKYKFLYELKYLNNIDVAFEVVEVK